MILTADWHLTDQPQDEYRWAVFDALNSLLERFGPQDVIHLGDLTDRKDRHSAALTNRLVASFVDGLHPDASSVAIIMGNHDKPLRGMPFWHILNRTDRRGLRFHIEPAFYPERGIALLPFDENPLERWAGIDFKLFRAAFIHQPIDGVTGENGYKVKGSPMPIFPRKLKVYAGDIHNPQRIGRLEYVGAPHPVDFGDNYKCRMLIVSNDTFEIEHEEILHPAAKAIVEITSLDQLSAYNLRAGDQIKVRLSLPADKLENWAAEERQLAAWAERWDVHISSVETLVRAGKGQASEAIGEDDDPRATLDAFATAEGLDPDCLALGHELLKAVK